MVVLFLFWTISFMMSRSHAQCSLLVSLHARIFNLSLDGYNNCWLFITLHTAELQISDALENGFMIYYSLSNEY